MNKPFRIVHFSDPHLTLPLDAASAFFDKRIIGRCNSLMRRGKSFRRERLPEAIRRILLEKPDLILFTGDATTCGQPCEFELAAEIFRPLFKSGIPVLYTPGNHDSYVRNARCRAALDNFRTLFANKPGTSVYDTQDIRFLIFDSARPTNPALSCGFFSKESAELLEKECANPQKTLAAVTHFPMYRTGSGIMSMRRKLHHAEAAKTFLKDGRLPLVFCGHIHTPYIEVLPGGGTEACAGSVTKAGIYRVADCSEGKVHFKDVQL